jgi:hypothetical protein
MMLDIGRDKSILVIAGRRGARGLYHGPFMEVIPEPAGSFVFYGKRCVLVHEHSPTTLNEKFLCVTQEIGDAIIEQGFAKNDLEVKNYIKKLEAEAGQVRERIELLEKVKAGVITADEWGTAQSNKLSWSSPEARENYAKQLADNLLADEDKFDELKTYLARLEASMTVPVVSKGILWEKQKAEESYMKDGIIAEKKATGGGTFHLFLHQLKVSSFRYFLPTGATLGDMWSHTQQALAAAKAEAGDDTVFKKWLPYIIFGVVTMMILIGAAYLVSQVKLP